MGLEPSIPLYVASHWPAVSYDLEQAVLGKLRAARYTVITSRDLQLPPRLAWRADAPGHDTGYNGWGGADSSEQAATGSGSAGDRAMTGDAEQAEGAPGGSGRQFLEGLGREQMAQMEYALAMASERFVGEWAGLA